MLVQLYGMAGTAPGPFTSINGDIKYAIIASGCPSGQPVGADVAKAGRVKTATVTLSKTSPSVEGILDVTFDDGSSLSGGFVAPVCAATLPENSVCF
jgi:hypothetical protein